MILNSNWKANGSDPLFREDNVVLRSRANYEKPIKLACKQLYSVWACPHSCGSMLIKIQPDARVCRYLFTAKSLYMFRVSQHPSSGLLKTVTSATSLQRGPIGPRWREVAVPVL